MQGAKDRTQGAKGRASIGAIYIYIYIYIKTRSDNIT